MIADNRLGELASWDGARLGLELEGLEDPRPRFRPLRDRLRDRRIDLQDRRARR